jgi:hypothetical protein
VNGLELGLEIVDSVGGAEAVAVLGTVASANS